MSMMVNLDPVISIDEEKCINCYACVTACPVKYCIDGSGDKLQVNHNLCIGCGNCISACSHEARRPIDDTNSFIGGLKKGEKIIAIAAPAVASVFAGNYLRLNGYLKSIGVDAFFDVSFGAELTVVSYINYIKAKKPKMVIAQPCPAIVTFIEIYHPELLPYLAPADSPMLHTLKMIREYYPEYKNHKMALISPCIAKKRELAETRIGDYNVTMLGLKNYLEQINVDLSHFPAINYIGPSAERAVTFSSPGGLLDTAERFIPGIRRSTRKIEGVPAIYHYLKGLSEKINNPNIDFPLLVDCLNCEMGCNGGTGTGNVHKTADELESPVRKRSRELEKNLNPKQQEKLYKKYHKLLNQYWKPFLYDREYKDLSANNTVMKPDETEINNVYKSLKKFTQSDLYNCTACGYGSCITMATAIHNKLNKHSNCAHFNLKRLEEEKKTTVYINQQLKTHITRAMEVVEKITNLVVSLNVSINTQSESVEESSAATEKILNSIKVTSNLSREKRESLMTLIDSTAKSQEAMKETIQAVQSISELIDGIGSAIKIISVIASNTNLLSMNAAIEAAHAGQAGKGFSVVADEIRRLSESTRENSRNIAKTLSSIISGINTSSRRSIDTGNFINSMAGEISGFARTMSELIDTLGKVTDESSSITTSLNDLRIKSSAVKTDYAEILSLTDKLRYDINFLAAMSADIVHAIEEDDEEIISKLMLLDATHSKTSQL